MNSAAYTLEELVEAVNKWCTEHDLWPANGQSAEVLSTRTLRYYRTMGLLSGPLPGRRGYGETHRLQLLAIRVLQAQGLPLRHIQRLLYGRSNAELRTILEKGIEAAGAAKPSMPDLSRGEDWQIHPLDDSVWLVLRHGRQLSQEQLSRLQAIINHPAVAAAPTPPN